MQRCLERINFEDFAFFMLSEIIIKKNQNNFGGLATLRPPPRKKNVQRHQFAYLINLRLYDPVINDAAI